MARKKTRKKRSTAQRGFKYTRTLRLKGIPIKKTRVYTRGQVYAKKRKDNFRKPFDPRSKIIRGFDKLQTTKRFLRTLPSLYAFDANVIRNNICKQRTERRRTLFAENRIGKGVGGPLLKLKTIKSAIKCIRR